MIFNSFSYLVFFPVVTLLYFLLPKKIRWVWLLVSSYYSPTPVRCSFRALKSRRHASSC